MDDYNNSNNNMAAPIVEEVWDVYTSQRPPSPELELECPMDFLIRFNRHQHYYDTVQLPPPSPSSAQIPYLPNEVLSKIFEDLTRRELKALRSVSRHWTYEPWIMTQLFRKVSIVPHETVLDEFVRTFAGSRAKYAFRKVNFCLARYFVCKYVAKWLEMMRDGKGVGDDGYERVQFNTMFTKNGEIHADEDRNWMECDQPGLLSRLIDAFACMPTIRKVNILCDQKFIQVVGRRGPGKEEKCSCGEVHSDSMTLREYASPLHPLCRLLYLCRRPDREGRNSPQMSRTIESVRSKKIINRALPGTIYQALRLSDNRVRCLSVDWAGDEVHSLRMAKDWTDAVNSFFTLDRTSNALLNLKHLYVGFWNHMTNTEDHSLARLQMLRNLPNLETLQIQWTGNRNRCFQLRNPDYCRAASNLVGIDTISNTPMFPKLMSLKLESLSCRSDELLYLVAFHCPKLLDLMLDTVAFIHHVGGPPDCWVKFLKQLKNMYSNRIVQLEIAGAICNSTYDESNNVNQHWHISEISAHSNPLAHPFCLKEKINRWFHDPKQTNEMCPLNLWELVQNGTILRGRETDWEQRADESMLRWEWEDGSWEDRTVFGHDDEFHVSLLMSD